MLKIVLGLIAVGSLWSTPAAAQNLTIDKLLGRWCGTESDYTFTRDRLIVEFPDKGPSRTLEIARVETSNTWIDVYWKPSGNTVFTDFSADGREMAQAQNTEGDMGPRRPFKRC
jgi:hypothetical protein